MDRAFFQLLSWCLLGLLALTSCSKEPPQPLRAGFVVWVGYAPFFVVAERKLSDPLQLEPKSFSAFLDMKRAFSEKKIDVASWTLFDCVRLADEGADIQIIQAIDASNGADGIVARQGIKGVADLKGKRVSADIGSVNHFVLLRALQRAGLTERDVELVKATPEEASVQFAQGKVDATVTWEPFLSRAVADGGAKIFTSAEIPNEILDVLVVTKDVAERRHDDLVQMVRGWERAVDLWRKQPGDVGDLMARSQGMKLDELKEGLNGIALIDLAGNKQLFDRANQGTSIWAAYEAAARFMSEAKLLKKPPVPADAVINPRIVKDTTAR